MRSDISLDDGNKLQIHRNQSQIELSFINRRGIEKLKLKLQHLSEQRDAFSYLAAICCECEMKMNR